MFKNVNEYEGEDEMQRNAGVCGKNVSMLRLDAEAWVQMGFVWAKCQQMRPGTWFAFL